MTNEEATEEQIGTRFLLELFEGAGEDGLTEDEMDAAWEKFHDIRIDHAIYEAWAHGFTAVSYRDEQLYFRLNTDGVALAESLGLLAPATP